MKITVETKEFSEGFRQEIADRTDNPKVLSEFAKDEDWGVKCAVAMNPNTSTETLSELAKDENWSVREAVAKNANTSTQTLSELAKDTEFFVRYAVEKNPNYKK